MSAKALFLQAGLALVVCSCLLFTVAALYITKVEHKPIILSVGQSHLSIIEGLSFTDKHLYKGKPGQVELGYTIDPCIVLLDQDASLTIGDIHLYSYQCFK